MTRPLRVVHPPRPLERKTLVTPLPPGKPLAPPEPVAKEAPAPPVRLPPAPEPPPRKASEVKEGTILIRGGQFVRVVDGRAVLYPCASTDTAELRALIGLRDTLMALLDAQVSSDDDSRYLPKQRELNDRYDAYSDRYGPLNRFKLVRTGRVNPDTDEPTHRRSRPRMGGFACDPDFYSVMALEVFDPDDQTATKAAIFSQRVLAPRKPLTGADDAQDALSVSLDRTGRVDLDLIANLLDVSNDEARAQLGALVYRDPVEGLVTASAYLSGDVRRKLDQAKDAAARDSRWEANVEALEAVQPVDLTQVDIDARLGCSWIQPSDIERFAQAVIGRCVVDHSPLTATWAVQAQTYERRSVAAISTWGTPRACAYDILEAALNQRSVQVYDPALRGEKRKLNAAETLSAREKQEELEARFATWIWENPERTRHLVERYNRLFNCQVMPHYDGSHLTFDGLNLSWRDRLHQHQKDAVWRGIGGPALGLFHAVGAGKTASGAMILMELRRLGMAKKPCIVVPNHMLDQWATDLLQMYPLARVLVATKAEVNPKHREAFVQRCASGDWDAILITHSAFERIPISKATRARFLKEQAEGLRDEAFRASQRGKLTAKKLLAAAERADDKLEAFLEHGLRDDGCTFEATGIDYLFIDESQSFKNLSVSTKLQGIAAKGSGRAEDMRHKVNYLRDIGRTKIATFATGTPITNTLAEMYVILLYLRPDVLEAAGVLTFDAWAANFAETVVALELSPDGGSYRLTERLARFRNLPELAFMFRTMADVRSKEDMNLPTPAIVGGEPKTVVVPGSEALAAYVKTLVARARLVKQKMVHPSIDNMLKIVGDGRKAALHLKLVGEEADEESKIVTVAAEVAKVYKANKNKPYLDSAGRESERRGAFQLVFCDMGTPKADGSWSVYKELAERIVANGVPTEKVRFVHEAKDDRQKAELFAACRDGRVSVLIGSSEKMGTGTNVQNRAIALHHIDCPWRPDILEQRDGRILRQGNQNDEVHIFRYVVTASFDVYMWQTVERKAGFIFQAMKGDPTVRHMEDIGEMTLDAGQVKALATGNPLLMEKAGVDNDVARLVRKRRAHEADQLRLAKALASAEESQARLSRVIRSCEAAIPRRVDTKLDLFRVTLEDREYTDRREAGLGLLVLIKRVLISPTVQTITGELAGLDLVLTRVSDKLGRMATLRLEPSPIEITMLEGEIGGTEPISLMTRLENRVRGLDLVLEQARSDLARVETELRGAQERIGVPFDQQLILEGLLRRQAEIARELEETLKKEDAA